MSAAEGTEKFASWAIVDVMGHQRYVGFVTEEVIAGQGFVRVDVPADDGAVAFSKLVGPGSIYAISPVSEDVARKMASERGEKSPVAAYDLPRIGSSERRAVRGFRYSDDADDDDEDMI